VPSEIFGGQSPPYESRHPEALIRVGLRAIKQEDEAIKKYAKHIIIDYAVQNNAARIPR
jgi:hypothetical protein